MNSTSSDLKKFSILVAKASGILIGGMAVDFWANHYGMETGGIITDDVDAIGSSRVTAKAAGEINSAFPDRDIKVFVADMDSGGSQNSKISIGSNSGDGSFVEVDMMNSVVGMDPTEMSEKAIRIDSGDGWDFGVEHPIHLMEHKISNISAFPNKRTDAGWRQAALSVAVVAGFLKDEAQMVLTENKNPRDLLLMVERIARFSLSPQAIAAKIEKGINVLSVIPEALVNGDIQPMFKERNYPEIIRRASESEEKAIKLGAVLQDGRVGPMKSVEEKKKLPEPSMISMKKGSEWESALSGLRLSKHESASSENKSGVQNGRP